MYTKRECTIVIPLYNRPNYLKRILDYYNNPDLNYEIIIADSSSGQYIKKDEKLIQSFKNINILYKKYSNKYNIYYYKKKADVLNYVNTRYCLFCAVDDFITPKAIERSIEFLEKHQDYSCVHGDYIGFKMIGDDFNCKILYKNYKSIESASAIERISVQLENYMQTIYSIHRTEQLKQSFQESVKYTNDARFGEILPSSLDLIYGKMKKINMFYCARENILDSDAKISETILDYIQIGSYDTKFKNFKICLAKNLSGYSDINFNKAEEIIEKSWNRYITKLIIIKRKKIISNKLKFFLNKINSSNWTDKDLSLLYYKLINQKNNKSKFKNKKNHINYNDDLKLIKALVLKYNNSE